MTGWFGRSAARLSDSNTKRIAIGAVIVALVAAALWFELPRLHSTRSSNRVAYDVSAGFVGEKKFGSWILNCPYPKSATQSALPAFSLTPAEESPLPPPPGSASTNRNALGRCRVVLRYFNAESRQVVMILSFRTIGKQNALAVILRFPLLLKKGDLVVIRSGASGFKLPVQQCQANVCLAAGQLGPRGEALLLASREGLIVLPPGSDGKRRAARIPFAETARALAAMRRAES